MKTVHIVFTAVAVLTVDCRGFTDPPVNSDDNATMSEAEGTQGYDSAELQVVKEKKNSGLQRTDCKIKRVCAALGGFCIVDTMEGCGGRVIPEYCAGSSCSCCIPDNQCVVEDGNNSILWHKIDSSVNEGYDNVTGVMETIIQNLTIELHSMEEHQGVMEKNIQNLTIELHSMEETIISQLGSKIDNIQKALDNFTGPVVVQCPGGFFKIGSHCYKMYPDTRLTWPASKAKCEADGYVMAGKPDDALNLRRYLFETFGSKIVWLGAMGDGTSYRWIRNDGLLSNSDPLWTGGPPHEISNMCLQLQSHENNVIATPSTVYSYNWCKLRETYFLCEYLIL